MRLAAAVQAAVILLPSASYAQAQSVQAQLDIPFELGPGEQVAIEPESVVVRFIEVI
jgi:hypothetical protein